MGFFNYKEYANEGPRVAGLKGVSIERVRELGCSACPLNRQDGVLNPNMDANGSKKPFIYMLGEAPSETDDRRGRHFAGKAGSIIRNQIPRDYLGQLRWNYTVRTFNKKTVNIPELAVEACRKSVVADIEQTKPFAIFGFGKGPLKWALDETHISRWVGRFIPVTIGTHTCWYFPMLDPNDVVLANEMRFSKEAEKYSKAKKKKITANLEDQFKFNMRDAFTALEALPDPVVHSEAFARKGVEYVTGERGDLDRVLAILDEYWDEPDVGFDYETSVLRPYGKKARILTVGLSSAQGSFAFPIHHPKAKWTAGEVEILEKELKRWLHKAPTKRLVHQLQFELEWTGVKYGRNAVLYPDWECTTSQAYILDERPYSNSLDFLCKQYFGLRMKSLSNMDRKNMAESDLVECLVYNGIDAKYHRLLWHVQRKRLKAEGLQKVYRSALSRVPTMALTQIKGVPINKDQVLDYFDEYTAQVKKAERAILNSDAVADFQKKYKKDFKVSSNPDVLKMLKDVLKLKLEKGTEEKELKKLKHPFVNQILAWRKPNKLLSTYVLPVMDDSPHMHNGWLHPIISTTKTRTWRTSSEEPNIQNWPKRGPSKIIRKQVAPLRDDEYIVAIDYAGIQARNVAMESLDRGLIKQYWDRYDIHGDWLRRLLKIEPNWQPTKDTGYDQKKDAAKWFKEARGLVKNQFVFPTFFGAQPNSISVSLGLDASKVRRLQDVFYTVFPDVHAWHDRLKKFYAQNGYVTGHSGFRRRAPMSPNDLINAPIQADETIIVCDAMTRLSQTGDELLQANMMIHDDLTFIWPKKDFDALLEEVVPVMVKKNFDWINVPLEIEISYGKNWADMKDLCLFESTAKGGYKEVQKL